MQTVGSETPTLEDCLIKRSPEGLPLLQNLNGNTLDPRYSQVVGTALIRGIDAERGELQVLCPLPLQKIEQIRERQHGIVLVSGKLDPPSWAYTEDLYKRSFDSNQKVDAQGDEPVEITDADTDDDASDNAEGDSGGVQERPGVPWVEMLYGNEKRAVGSRVWRVRRDLGKSGNVTD